MQAPFTLTKLNNNDIGYINWRDNKLKNSLDYSQNELDSLFIEISDASKPTSLEVQKLLDQCAKNNFCLYKIKNENSDNKEHIHTLAKHIGLSQLDNNICADSDSLTSITNISNIGQREYIPYSTKRLSWHTDGYYNTPDNTIKSMLLHCVRPAKEGGESLLMDHELAYIFLREENPSYIEALMQKDAMTIPANIVDGEVIREAQTGPVFSISKTGQLHMRYSARKRNIEWKNNAPTLKAVALLGDLLEDSKHIIKHTLKAGEGLICRNILHRRTAFVDFEESNKKRLLYRGRYFNEITPQNYKTPKNRGGGK